jgi:hypothetical protein
VILKQQPFINKAGLKHFQRTGDLILARMAGPQMRLGLDGFKSILSLIQQAVRKGDIGCLFLMDMEAI